MNRGILVGDVVRVTTKTSLGDRGVVTGNEPNAIALPLTILFSSGLTAAFDYDDVEIE